MYPPYIFFFFHLHLPSTPMDSKLLFISITLLRLYSSTQLHLLWPSMHSTVVSSYSFISASHAFLWTLSFFLLLMFFFIFIHKLNSASYGLLCPPLMYPPYIILFFHLHLPILMRLNLFFTCLSTGIMCNKYMHFNFREHSKRGSWDVRRDKSDIHPIWWPN